MKIIKYEVVTSTSLIDINDEINRQIQNGWQPLGGICRNYIDKEEESGDYQESEYAQAMVIYEEPD